MIPVTDILDKAKPYIVGWIRGYIQASARVYNTTPLTLTTGVTTTLPYSTVSWDNNSMWNAGNNTRLTAQTAGVYAITGYASFAANATGRRVLGVYINGSGSPITNNGVAACGGGSTMDVQVLAIYQLNQNDYVELKATQDSGGNLNVQYQTLLLHRLSGF